MIVYFIAALTLFFDTITTLPFCLTHRASGCKTLVSTSGHESGRSCEWAYSIASITAMNLQKVLLSLALGSGAAFSPSTGSMRASSTSLRMSVAVGEQFPAGALSKIGVSGKPAVLYFYGADEAPSCA